MPPTDFAHAVRTTAVRVSYDGEVRRWVMMAMSSFKAMEGLMPVTLEALSRIPLDQGLAEIGASILPDDDKSGSEGDGGAGDDEDDDGKADRDGNGEEAASGSGGDDEGDEEREAEAGRSRRSGKGRSGRRYLQGLSDEEGDGVDSGAGSTAAPGSDGPGGPGPGPNNGGGGSGAVRMLSSVLIINTWDTAAQQACLDLRERFGHRCVQDFAFKLPGGKEEGMTHFHSPQFGSMGFAKIKYMYNVLSLGVDVLSMDADVLFLRSPLPRLLPMRAQIASLTEKCEVVDPALPLESRDVRKPAGNIGLVAARAEAPALRCVERWFGAMVAHLDDPQLWDQAEFDHVTSHCSMGLGLRLRVFDNRAFVSMCQPGCGCAYGQEDIELLHADPGSKRHRKEYWRREGHPYVAGAGGEGSRGGRMCGPKAWANWTAAHFPCQGGLLEKRSFMAALLEGHSAGQPRAIKAARLP
ncbi:hypothetical protein HYH03_012707 [Edaphochlamys debaryana]|uniref:Nucleotide-diphospho-sugar transferase domain-containing protein n=1 Tax=Edaphochlamys debaryana TaxID=47281 RepID=A0A835XS90_9CHLO|nr:hypothetical protein HYH03_012707 [Edaphochlamys debaryana]|eukprot:KAG2488707.1 hypothetical protein HYH03_012707 [Edaphochlamys debaryana]